jgi:5'-nucleotidase (lipoprotein e(P4) family)
MNAALNRALALVLTLALLAGCASTPKATEAAANPAISHGEDNLNATLWMQTAAEYRAAAIQAWHQAYPALDRMLEARHLSAAPEQLSGFADLPPAIIVDVDETVLDNSPYQARLIRDAGEYGSATWDAWCNEASARPIPGAKAFLNAAAAKGVTIFYVSNRTQNLLEVTRKNLVDKGFPMRAGVETLLMRDEPRGYTGSKGTRRALIAKNYRVVLMAGDNLGDFIDTTRGTPADRFRVIRPYRNWWGERWIMLPNPLYGSWEDSLLGFERGISADVKRGRKVKALRVD